MIGFPLASFLGPLVLYLLTLAPTVTLEDSGEFITAAYHLGIAHPPGYPLYGLAAHVFTWIPWGNVAQRVHLFSAYMGAAACLMTFFACLRLTKERWGSLWAAWTLGASRYLWSQSVVAEVYSLNAFLVAASIVVVLAFQDTGRARYLYALFALIGLGAANHLLMVQLAPIFLIWAACAQARMFFLAKHLVIGVACLALPLALYLYLPLRASADPPINMGDPDTWERFVAHVLRTTYASGEEVVRQGGDLTDATRHSGMAFVRHFEAFGVAGLIFAMMGAIRLWRTRRSYLIASVAIILFTDVLTNVLLEERFNASWSFVHRVYYIPSDIVLATWIGSAFSFLATTAAAWRSRMAIVAHAVGPLIVLATVAQNYSWCDRSNDRTAEIAGRAVLRSLPTGACLLAPDDFVFTLVYLNKVAGERPDVQILDEKFGYDSHKGCRGLYSLVPWVPAFDELYPSLKGVRAEPDAAAYRLVSGNSPPSNPADFRTLPKPPAVPPPSPDPDDVFDRFARSILANYYTRVGLKYHALGEPDLAKQAFAQAESSAANAYAYFLLGEAYRHTGLQTGREVEMYRKALELYDRYHDPASDRFNPITREQIIAALNGG